MFDLGISKAIKAKVIIAVSLIGAFVVTGIIGFATYKFYSLSTELSETKASLVLKEAENTRLTEISNDNAAAALRAEADRRVAVETLEFVQAGKDEVEKTSRLAIEELQTSPPEDNAPTSAALRRLLERRLGTPK